MTDEHRAENEACEALVLEYRETLVRLNSFASCVVICDELARQIRLRRVLDVDTTSEALEARRLAAVTARWRS
jgi:hypothetical protein